MRTWNRGKSSLKEPDMKHPLIVAALVAAAMPATAANMLTGGSFEAPDLVAGNAYVLYGHGSTSMTGWTVEAPNPQDNLVQLTPDTYAGLLAADGRQWLDLTGIYGYNKGVRSDAIAVDLGATYQITFAVGTYPGFGAATLGLSINGGTDQLFANPNIQSPMQWTTHSLLWTADSSNLQLTFLGRANGALSNNGVIGLDAVSVELMPVPEPGNWALMIAGLALMGAHAGKRNRRR
jgi:hypothetical protein